MDFATVKGMVRALREIADWPEALELIDRVGHREHISVWDYPFASCQAVGGADRTALPGAAAIFCSLLSIHLVDDILDDEPDGEFRRLGAGQIANIALAFQAAGHRLLDDPCLEPAVSATAQSLLARMALGTAYGQGLDIQEARNEEEYWRIVEAKTPPLFGAAFEIGALLGSASADVAGRLAEIGRILGRMIQVSDDLSDALKTPAKVDWNRPRNNIAILYALTAHHPARDQFSVLASRSEDPEALAEAHRILLKSGAISYCAFKMIELSRQAQEILDSTALRAPEHVAKVLQAHRRPIHRLLESAGVEQPELVTT